MKMTIDEAIRHCEEVAEQNEQGLYDAIALGGQNPTQEEIANCEQCAADHRQLAEWLKELQELRLQIEAPRLGSIEEYHYELAKCKAAFWSCNRRCMDAEEQYRRKADELRKAQEQIAEYNQLGEQLGELEAKHWDECRQIAHYDDELQKIKIPAIVAALENLDANDMIRELKRLLKIAMADLRESEDCSCCIFDSKQCPGVTGDCTFKWKHHDESIELMGGENI